MLYIIRGPSGYGKSTLAKKIVEAGFAEFVFEADDYFTVGKNYWFDKNNLPAAHNRCYHNTIRNLSCGRNVVVSNTFVKLWELSRYIEYCKQNNIPFKVIRLTHQFVNTHGVPEHVVNKMIRMMEDYPGEILVNPLLDHTLSFCKRTK